ncbi:hypothetical protein [Dongia deserti]|uniref:hypothetical protein n=1 Tax=Dongia deserti TaxID=2268030 RepID=UPI0013C484A8|nr:hypothetical protein [Dongia deserti]
MRSSILLSSVAIVAFAAPAFAIPDRYEQGYGCTGLTGVECMRHQMLLEDGDRRFENATEASVPDDASDDVTEATDLAARTNATGEFDEEGDVEEAAEDAGDEISDLADDTGDEISDFAEDAGSEIEDTAEDAGAEIADAADDAGDAVADAFD